MEEPGTTPAGWYSDPAGDGGVRYWDGTAWTAHTAHPEAPAPTPEPRRLSPGAIVAIVLGSIFALILLVGVLTAIAIPLYLHQKEIEQQAAPVVTASPVDDGFSMARADGNAQKDLRVLGLAVSGYLDVHGVVPEAGLDGRYVVFYDADGEYSRLPLSEGIDVTEYLETQSGFCVGAYAAAGSVGSFHITETLTVAEGPCPATA